MAGVGAATRAQLAARIRAGRAQDHPSNLLDQRLENLALPELGLPRDLNGDHQIDGADHSLDKRILPVLVRLRWRGPTGVSRMEFKTLVAPY